MHWLFSDHNGSSQLALDARTGETVQRRFTPFGELRSSSASWPGDKGYVGGTVDEATGLTQLGARAYDAAIGRFISVDPLMDTGGSQMVNGYSYANNSPVTLSDANGLNPCMCPPWGGGGSSSASDSFWSGVDWGSVGNSLGNYINGGSGSSGGGGYGGSGYYGGGGSKGRGFSGGSTNRNGAPKPVVDPYDNTSYKDPVGNALDSARALSGPPGGVPGAPPGCVPNPLNIAVNCYIKPGLDIVSEALSYWVKEILSFINKHVMVGAEVCPPIIGYCGGVYYQDGVLIIAGSGWSTPGGDWSRGRRGESLLRRVGRIGGRIGLVVGINRFSPRETYGDSLGGCISYGMAGGCGSLQYRPDGKRGIGIAWSPGVGMSGGSTGDYYQYDLRDRKSLPISYGPGPGPFGPIAAPWVG
ncbi:RHS repeat domain-containing protein [Nocardiopsis chromatogenes]|uniref:RHS repeat domain-containing protein n=1 Tax=Nocardiopsis chromatogenes TaxID=280239 RepID=UPI00373AED0C